MSIDVPRGSTALPGSQATAKVAAAYAILCQRTTYMMRRVCGSISARWPFT